MLGAKPEWVHDEYSILDMKFQFESFDLNAAIPPVSSVSILKHACDLDRSICIQ
jgi:hypothetical protein